MDKITVRMYGRDVEIPRGDMDDKEWEKVKKQAAIHAPDESTAGDMLELQDSVTRVRAPDEEQATERIKESLKTGYKPTQADVKKVSKETVEERKARKAAEYEEETGDPADERPRKVEKKEKAGGLRGLVNSFMLRAAPGETPDIPGGDRRRYPAGQAVDEKGNPRRPNQAVTPTDQEGNPVPAVPTEHMDPSEQEEGGAVYNLGRSIRNGIEGTGIIPSVAGGFDLAKRAGGVIGDAAENLGAGLTGQPVPQLNQPPVAPAAPNRLPPTTVGMPSAPAPGATAKGSSSVSLSARVPGAGAPNPFPEDPQLALMDVDRNNLQRDKADSIRELAEAQARASESLEKLYQEKYARDAQIAKTEQDRQEFVQKGLNDIVAQQTDLRKKLQDPVQTPDPERYWKNHSKVLFAIGVGLLAANNRDISGVLGSVQHAIDADIKAQEDAFNAPRKSAKDQIELNNNFFAQFRQLGMDNFEAARMSKATAHEMLADRIAELAAHTDNEMIKANAPGLIAKEQEAALKEKEAALQHRGTLKVQQFAAQTGRMNAETNAFKATTKAAGGGKHKLNTKEEATVQSAKTGLTTIGEIRKLLGPEQGLMGALGEEAALHVPLFTNKTKQAAKAIEALNFKLATAVSQSSLQAHEQKFWLGEDGKGGVLGNKGLSNMSHAQLDALQRDLTNAYLNTENGTIGVDYFRQGSTAVPGESAPR